MLNKTILWSALTFATIAPFASDLGYAKSSSSLENAITDTAITAKVKTLYAKSPVVKVSKVAVTTVNHNVILTGQLKTSTQYERAITLAESVKGVKYVNADNLTVKASKAPLSDAYTTARVKGRFIKGKLFGEKDIEYWPVKVETKDSIVYLTGQVKTPKERGNLVRIAQSVKGVKAVDSALTIK